MNIIEEQVVILVLLEKNHMRIKLNVCHVQLVKQEQVELANVASHLL